jgi:ricin-type beta-trefoil lectin protein/putative Ig domain-containing protein
MLKFAALLSGLIVAAALPIVGLATSVTTASAATAAPVRSTVHAPRGVTFRHIKARRTGKPVIFLPRVSRATLSSTGNLEYLGGPIQSDVRIHLLFWGYWWDYTDTGYAGGCYPTEGNGLSSETYLYNFYSGLGTSSDYWSRVMSQYGDGFGNYPTYPNPNGTALEDSWVDCGNNPPSSATAADLSNEAYSWATWLEDTFGTSFGSNDQIVIVSPSGDNPDGWNDGSNFCAEHNSTVDQYGNPFSFTNLPFIPDAGSNCGASFVQNSFDGWSIVGGHEYAEAVTDPFPSADSTGSPQYPTAWDYTPNGLEGENGDLCAWQHLGLTTLSTGTFAMQPTWSNSANGCLYATVNSPGNQSTNLNASVSLQVTGSATQGSPSFSASGLPTGLSIDSATGLVSGTATWPGNYNVTVAATVGGLSSLAKFTWQVFPASGAVKLHYHNTHCMDEYRSSLTNGTKVDVWGCNGTLAQTWAGFPDDTVRRYGGPSAINTGKCLDIKGASTANGTKVDLYRCNGKWNQVWSYNSTTREWVNPHSGKCLSDPASNLTNGTQLIINTCTDSHNEQWSNL